MKAMILAAGEGRRLRPLTDKIPKALVEIEGAPMLEIVLRRLIAAGTDAVVINVCHLPEPIEEFLKCRRNFGIRVEFSRERELLDTGGGLKKAAAFFGDGKPFFLHNVDILSDVDLGGMYRAHADSGALATLAVQSRPADRALLFDARGRLRGWESSSENRRIWAAVPENSCERAAFCGIHVISPEIFPKMSETGVFSIVRAYLRLAGEGEAIRAFRCDRNYCRDIGGLDKLEEIRREVRSRGLRL